jgi:hypothetical protein
MDYIVKIGRAARFAFKKAVLCTQKTSGPDFARRGLFYQMWMI